jgi:hypothetical protein
MVPIQSFQILKGIFPFNLPETIRCFFKSLRETDPMKHNFPAKINWILIAVILALAISCGTKQPRLQAVTSDEGVEIMEGDSKILFYQVKPRTMGGAYERAGYIHPLYSLEGSVITEDFPEDHPHHHGIFSAWHQITLNGKPVADGWTGDNISWTVVDTQLSAQRESIALNVEVVWRSSIEGGQEGIVSENLEIVVHELKDERRAIDYNLFLTPLKDSLKLGGSADEKGYGGFSLRLKLPGDIRFIAGEKEVEPKVVSVEAGPWINFTGSFDGEEEGDDKGVLVLNHPSNPGSPQPWILRKEKSMQNAAYPGRHPVSLSKQGLRLRYRMIVHNGDLDKDAIETLYREYSSL